MADSCKKEFHYFLLTDYEKEEELLRRRQRDGLKFVRVRQPGVYYFESCCPEDVVYKLDFYPQTCEERDCYIKMYEDYGWEYIQEMNGFHYFRKAIDKSSGEETADGQKTAGTETEIFSDNASKLDMLKRIFLQRMLLLFGVFMACFLPQFIFYTGGIAISGGRFVVLALLGILFAFYIYILIHCGIGFYRLGKKYSDQI